MAPGARKNSVIGHFPSSGHLNRSVDIRYSVDKFNVIEAVARRCSVKKVFLEISQNAQENACARVCNFIKKEALT